MISSSSVPMNNLLIGSVWEGNEPSSRLYANICEKMMHVFQKMDMLIIRLNDHKNGYLVNCTMDRKALLKDRKCTFIVHAKFIGGKDKILVTKCCLEHSCGLESRDLEVLRELELSPLPKRLRSVKLSTLEHSSSIVLKSFTLNDTLSSAKTGDAKALSKSISIEGAISLTERQCRSEILTKSGKSLHDYIMDYSLLPSLFLKLQEADPKGVYYLETRPLSYIIYQAPVRDRPRPNIATYILGNSGLNFVVV